MDGLWIANFTAGTAHGSGVVIVRSGEIMGGDLAHTYKGSWYEDGTMLNARVRVEPWTAKEESEAETREKPLMLTLKGSCTDKSATLAGHPDEKPDLLISIDMKRAA